ncbi:MAG: hypothetical protein Q7T10_16475 [Rhodoferax sp.]|uniref:hypothetical protein n=1 Tax=Rhodoferax sp. TaxID=50421 RepID=UPI002719566B|nr:hypothetical protein [Rhodoferax sp.]MDO8450394.1 hypothetical protein [Rhodoferax sp.]
MRISPFFLQLRSAYQSEMDDLTFDSEGRDVLRQRLTERRQELGFLLQMIELSPEMVAVIFHQGFRFRLPAVMDHLLTHESDEFPDWDTLADAAQMTPWAQDLTQIILKEPMGAWFLTVAAGLEYMYGKPDAAPAVTKDTDTDDGADDDEGDEPLDEFDAEEERDARAREEAGADWMVEQGFDRKDR